VTIMNTLKIAILNSSIGAIAGCTTALAATHVSIRWGEPNITEIAISDVNQAVQYEMFRDGVRLFQYAIVMSVSGIVGAVVGSAAATIYGLATDKVVPIETVAAAAAVTLTCTALALHP
jgi:hypothetical protein